MEDARNGSSGFRLFIFSRCRQFCKNRLSTNDKLLLTLFVFFAIIAGGVESRKVSTVKTTIPVFQCPKCECQKQVFVRFTDKPDVELCSSIIDKLEPSAIVFYVNLISSGIAVAILFTVLAGFILSDSTLLAENRLFSVRLCFYDLWGEG